MNCLKRGVGFEEAVLFDRWDSRVGNREYGFVSFFYDVFILYGRQPDWYDRTGTFLWQQGICWTFILISGMVWHFGKKGSLKRGLLLNFWGLVISAVTCVAEPQAAVWFGILNFIGCAVLLMIPLDRIFRRIPPVAGIVVSMVLFFFFGMCRVVCWGWLLIRWLCCRMGCISREF